MVEIAVFIALCGAIVVGIRLFLPQGPQADELLQSARTAFAANDYDSAVAFAELALQTGEEPTEALLVAGASAAALEQFDKAVAYYDRLPPGDNPATAAGHAIAANLLLFKLGRASDAEQRFREILARHPRHFAAVNGLANLLGLTGRRPEATDLLIELVRQDKISVNQLTLLGSEDGAHSEPDLHRRCLEASPDDPLPWMGLAWQAAHDGNVADAEQLIRSALETPSPPAEAYVRLGTLLAARQRFDELQDWSNELPPESEDHPDVWRVRGDLAKATDQPEAAIRCYWETLRQTPNSRAALQAIVQLLHAREEPDMAAPFAERNRQLQTLAEYESVLFQSRQTSLTPVENVASQMEVLGRIWESWAWARFALKLNPSADWAIERSRRLKPLLKEGLPLTVHEQNPAFQVDFSHFPRPTWPRSNSSDTGSGHTGSGESSLADAGVSDVRFEDQAAETGFRFRYFNSGDSAVAGQYMYEFTGGGIAVLDYDRDGRPDLYHAQGCRWPPDRSRNEQNDGLFRNVLGRSLRETASPARIRETSFSQGVTTGDFDNDGFPDLYVANIGRNRLFLNNGDGTFSDVTDYVAGATEQWTTSCLMADLDGDGFPDLYDVNYLTGDDIFERMCEHKDGAPRMCAPFDFPGAPDQFLLNSADGRFTESTAEFGLRADNGKGLGIVAADFEGTGRLNLFIANDLVPNHYFRNESSSATAPPATPLFAESAQVTGLSFDHAGTAQGCMGIAVDDLTGDGRLDLFVTNFALERNAFYVQDGAGFFQDQIPSSGISEHTLPMLGFGTQTLDGDLDGRPDLIVTNGHIDDHRAYGRQYHMPPQYFRNIGGGRFAAVDAESLGPFFSGEYLGRAMARLDWNADGREDVAISHLDSPAALLTNTTPTPGNSITVHLVGTTSSRDAVGANVTVSKQDGNLVRQLTAGDGYQAANQRVLVFGLGASASIDSIAVDWPSGRRQLFENFSPGREILLIENRDRPVIFDRNLQTDD